VRGIEGEQVLLRLILSESRTHEREPLVDRLLAMFRAEGLAGVTVLKGLAGFGHDRSVHTVGVEVAAHGLPVVLEAVDTPERIEQVLPRVEALMVGGVIMLKRARVIRYAPGGALDQGS
jgi:PII-like signaling protein